MARQELRNRAGVLLGWREQIGKRIEGRDRTGFFVGYYEPQLNETRDRAGRLVGQGDLLSTLITMP